MQQFSRKIPFLALALTLAMALTLPGAGRAATPGDEDFHYRWSLRNFVGVIAGLFLPRQGDGQLTSKMQPNGHLTSELTITSNGHEGEYWRYGAEIDPEHLRPIRAWSSYVWHGKTKSKNSDIDQKGVLDIVSGIYSIRRDPPTKSRRLSIWSDGDLYDVVVLPKGTEQRSLGDGSSVQTRHYAIRGVDLPGKDEWKGKIDLWLALDDAATPVVIQISRALADVRLELKSLPKAAQQASH
ncbi:MAG TPA: DUF3108 domain-containing protein [Thermoanaerobaculia bacterium]|jgi:hypothetical protein|nr:DUF3108 domain-containing protein [Thermoanaerobaculia bacterium]